MDAFFEGFYPEVTYLRSDPCLQDQPVIDFCEGLYHLGGERVALLVGIHDVLVVLQA